ncbi:MAG: VWA domain-containing protein [Spirochaetales bacterium]|nr:VWA domain-containing protein [Spirochaetales bacterium]
MARKAIQYGIIISFVVVSFLILFISCSSARMDYMAKGKYAPNVAREDTGYIEEGEPLPEGEEDFNTEEYDRIYENRFLKAKDNPLSTFSIDVDTASYSNMRRFLTQGSLPYKDAIRIEELINYFTYDYPEPSGTDPFSSTIEVSECPWNRVHKLLHIGLQAKKISLAQLPPNNLVFLLDVSGSMSDPNKLPLLQESLKLLVNEMREIDSVAIVVYAGAAGMVLPPTKGTNKKKIVETLEELYAGGSTAGGEGIKLAYKVAEENFTKKGNNRVILATDGDFNVGPSSDAALIRLIEEEREKGIFLTVLGFGMGNYKDSKMEKLADKGNGNYAYIDTLMEAKKVLVTQMGGTLLTIAKDVKVQIEFNPAMVESYRLIGYENRILSKEDFADDTKDAGELGAGHTVTVLYELIMNDSVTEGESDLRYTETEIKDEARKSNELMFLKFRYKKPDEGESVLKETPVVYDEYPAAGTSDNFRFSAAVAEFGLLLRDSEYKGEARFDRVLSLAEGAIGQDAYGYRKEFLTLVKKAEELSAQQ